MCEQRFRNSEMTLKKDKGCLTHFVRQPFLLFSVISQSLESIFGFYLYSIKNQKVNPDILCFLMSVPSLLSFISL